MNKNGFVINKLVLTGNNVKPAMIKFENGLNVISGPTSTGKSFIFDCLNFMLGGKSLDRRPPEADNYDKLYLQIESDSIFYTLERAIRGGKFNLFETEYDSIQSKKPKVILGKLVKDNDQNISSFFLNLCNLNKKEIRKNQKGTKFSLSFRDLCHLCLISENEITKTESPIFTKGGFQKTKELNVVKFLVTGKDDNAIITEPDEKILNYRKGKEEALDELITQFNVNVSKDIASPDESIRLVDEEIKSLQEKQNGVLNQFSVFDEQRKLYSKKILGINISLEALNETLTRSELLREYYHSDLKRLNSTIEAGLLLSENTENFNTCPYCNNEIESLSSNSEITKTISSCESEISKVDFLLQELEESLILLNAEKSDLEKDLIYEKTLLIRVESFIDSDINSSLKEINAEVKELYENRNSFLQQKFTLDSIEKFKIIRIEMSSINDTKVENAFDELTTSKMYPISERMYKILDECNYSDVAPISFSEKTNDFVIGSKNRNLSGKGERAITYATFVLALSEFLENKTYKMGVPIFDSPLVTYRKPESDGEGISEDLAMDFYRYCANKTTCPQIIILENEEPPEEILKNINHIKFTKKEGIGRYGFIPK